MTTTTERIQLNRKTAAQWTAANTVLLPGEAGVELDTGKVKFGNGTSGWTALPYSYAGAAGVTTVNSRSGDVVVTAADVGLGNVQNTSDANKPVSTAQAAALAAKADYPTGGVNGQALVKSGTTTAWTTIPTGGTGGSFDWGYLPAPSGGDDTPALTAELATGATQYVARAGTYRITSLTVPQNVTITGSAPLSYLGNPPAGTIFQQTGTGTARAIVLSTRSAIINCAVRGNGVADCIGMAFSCTVQGCSISGGVTGIYGNYSSVCRIVNNNINGNSQNGIKDIVDSFIEDNYINANGTGISLGNGANDNVISTNKLEFNNGKGLDANAASHLIITDNVVDRNGSTGIHLAYCYRVNVVGNSLRRNGGNQSAATAATDTHLHIEGCTGVTVAANTTETGANDDGSGYLSPRTTVYLQDNTAGVRIVGNDWTGFTGTPTTTVGTNTGVVSLGNSTGSVEVSPRLRGVLGAEIPTFAAAAGTVTQAFPAVPLFTFHPGQIYVLDAIARDETTGGHVAARIGFVVYREGGNAAVNALQFTQINGTGFAATGGTHNVAVTCNTDGSTLTVTVVNGSANPVQYSLTLH